MQYSSLDVLLCPIGQVPPATAASQVLRGHWWSLWWWQKRTLVLRPTVGHPSSQPSLEEETSSLFTEGLAQGHSQDSTWPGTGPPPARITLRKRRGVPGRGQELPAPAWARQHTGRNVPSSAGPPSACRLPHPGIAGCNPGAGGGCSEYRRQSPCPLSPPCNNNPHLPFVHKRVPRKPGYVQAWKSACTQLPKELTTPGLTTGWQTMP